MSDDPVFRAMAALEQLKIHSEEPDAAHSVAEAAMIAARKENTMTLDGEEMRTHEQIDAHFTPAFGPEDEEKFNRFIERLCPRHLSDAERDRARQAAHDELTRHEAQVAEVEQRMGYREIEARQESANYAVWDAEYDVMEAKPATPTGAITLLRFVADLMEGFFPDDDEHEHYIEAIRNAADFFEGGLRHEQEARENEDTQSTDLRAKTMPRPCHHGGGTSGDGFQVLGGGDQYQISAQQ
jgi:hypothetical protein